MKIKKYKPYLVILLDPDAVVDAINMVFLLKNIYEDLEYKIKFVFLKNSFDIDELKRNLGNDEIIKELYDMKDCLSIDDLFIKKLHSENGSKRIGMFNKWIYWW